MLLLWRYLWEPRDVNNHAMAHDGSDWSVASRSIIISQDGVVFRLAVPSERDIQRNGGQYFAVPGPRKRNF